MTRLRLAAVPLNQTPLDWEGNLERIGAALDAAREAEAAVLCLPELCLSGYGCEDAFFSAGVQQTSLDMLVAILPETQGLAVCLGLPLLVDGQLYNTCAMACDGELLGVVCKQHLAGDGIHYEPRWFRRWPAGVVQRMQLCGRDVPLGDLLFDLGGVRVGMEICRDAWVARRTGATLAARGADVLLNPSASHFSFNKQEVRRRFVLEGSRMFCASVVYCNLLGNESGRAIYDGGALIASGGKMLAEGQRLSFTDGQLTAADVDVQITRRQHAANSQPTHPASTYGGATIRCEFQLPAPTLELAAEPAAAWNGSPASKEEEFSRAVALGLFDYLRKSNSQGLVVSLSGGADSSAVAALVWLMVELSVAELGREGFVQRLAHISDLQGCKSSAALVDRLLTCVYQSTRNSGDATKRAAVAVAQAIGARFYEWPLDDMVDRYVAAVSAAVDRELTWGCDDAALQNIQARARGPGVWLLANLQNALLLTTSNRSEAAVGYATMDGDTCGGLAPIAGIDKAFLLGWLKWLETTGPEGVGPLPALACVNQQAPTAELRPPSEAQTDEGDLMPYRVLDAIERRAIRDKLPPVDVFAAIRRDFPKYDAPQLGAWVERFFVLWCRNQWKRERYAPTFHVDDENLDPKTWCRFPILSGGYERELAELRKAVASMPAPPH